MSTPDHESFDLNAALREIATDAGRAPGDPGWATSIRTMTARRRRRHRAVMTSRAAAAALLVGGGVAWINLPSLLHNPTPGIVTPAPSRTPSPSDTPTPTPTTATPTQTPTEPAPTHTPTEPPAAQPSGPAVLDGYTSPVITPQTRWDSAPSLRCGDQLPELLDTKSIVSATVDKRITLTGDSASVPVAYHVPATVRLEGSATYLNVAIAKDGVIIGVGISVPDGSFPLKEKEGEVTLGKGILSRQIGCSDPVSGFQLNPNDLAPGTYEAVFWGDIDVSGYSLQQQDGTWGARQDTTTEVNGYRAGRLLSIVTNTFTLVVK